MEVESIEPGIRITNPELKEDVQGTGQGLHAGTGTRIQIQKQQKLQDGTEAVNQV